jgi:rSAM/selenodomain-associated transferase 1
MKKALVIFVREPELGKVKTRLAKTMGDARALEIYKEMLRHTRDITCGVSADKFVFYTELPATNSRFVWDPAIFFTALQQGGDLGERMRNAFELLFSKGYQKLCIIGSDCMGLTSNHIEDAFAALDMNDMVIGPSTDGGYYLLGMKELFTELFSNKLWSTDSVLPETIKNIKSAGKTFHLLRALTDIDTEDDWNQYKNIKTH